MLVKKTEIEGWDRDEKRDLWVNQITGEESVLRPGVSLIEGLKEVYRRAVEEEHAILVRMDESNADLTKTHRRVVDLGDRIESYEKLTGKPVFAYHNGRLCFVDDPRPLEWWGCDHVMFPHDERKGVKPKTLPERPHTSSDVAQASPLEEEEAPPVRRRKPVECDSAVAAPQESIVEEMIPIEARGLVTDVDRHGLINMLKNPERYTPGQMVEIMKAAGGVLARMVKPQYAVKI